MPLYSLKVAEEIIPISTPSLANHLYKADFPKRYMRDSGRRRHRMLTAQEIRYIRSRWLIYNAPDGERRLADSEGL